MSEASGLILALPVSPAVPLRWWRVGEDGESLSSGELAMLNGEGEKLADITPLDEGTPIMALLPVSETAIYFAEWTDLTPAQASAAASLQAARKSMSPPEDLHVASAVSDPDGDAPLHTISAAVSAQYLSHWLDELALAGIDADIVMPAGLVLPVPQQDAVAGDIGNGAMLRTAHAIFSDEDALRSTLLKDTKVTPLDADAMEAQMLAAFAAPPLNMRQGIFAPKRENTWLNWAQIKRLAMMAAAVLLLTLAIFLIQIGKYSIGANQVRDSALNKAQITFPAATDIASAEQMADEALYRRGLGGRLFTVPTSALFAAIEPLQGISVRQLSYQADGTVAVTLAAARKEDIDAALILLQRQGYVITVPPALTQDTTGSVVANITVRIS